MGLNQDKVLVVERAAKERSALCAYLGSRGFTAVGEESIDGLNSMIDVFDPDLLLIELNGIPPDVVVSTVRTMTDGAVVFVVPRGTPSAVRAGALEAGADDVIGLDVGEHEVALRVDAILHRRRPDRAIRVHDVVIDEAGYTVRRGGHEIDLTATEFRLLTALARNAGVVISKRRLLGMVWGFDDYDVNLVEVHVSALRRKLEEFGPRIVHTVRAFGYVVRADSCSHAADGSSRSGELSRVGVAGGA